MEQQKMEQRLMASADDTMAFNAGLTEIRKVFDELRALKSQFEREGQFFLRHIFKQTDMITEQSRAIQELGAADLKKLCSDFGDLAKVTRLKEAYEQTMPEISRRRRRGSAGDFSQRLADLCKNIAACVKFENKLRANFLKKYANILLENFVPDLKALVPEFPGEGLPWTAVDKHLPSLANLHRVEDVALARVEGEVGGLDLEENRAALESLEAERKELRQKVLQLEKRVAGLKIDLGLLKEKVGPPEQNESLSYVDQADTTINVGSYYKLLDGGTSALEKKATVAEVLKANAKQMYKFFGPMLAAKNSEIKELRKELVENKLR